MTIYYLTTRFFTSTSFVFHTNATNVEEEEICISHEHAMWYAKVAGILVVFMHVLSISVVASLLVSCLPWKWCTKKNSPNTNSGENEVECKEEENEEA